MDLLPRPLNILLLQKDLICRYKLKSERIVSEAGVRLRVLPFESTVDEYTSESGEVSEIEKFYGLLDETNGSAHTVNQLPLLLD